MGDGSLSQDEIDALLQGADEAISTPSAAPVMDIPQKTGSVSQLDREALADLLNSTMQTVVPSLSGFLDKDIEITNAVVEIKSQSNLRAELKRQYVQVSINYSGGFNGGNLIIFNIGDAGIISSLMMGDDPGAKPDELTEAHQSTINEFVNQMLSSLATGFSNKLGRSIDPTSPMLSIVNDSSELKFPQGQDLVKITYNITIEKLLSSKFYHIMDLPLGIDLSRAGASGGSSHIVNTQTYDAPQASAQQVGISSVKFPPLGESVPYGTGTNISLLMDVPLTLTVELGRTKYYVKDILSLGEGSIIELDKLAGEPVDLLVSGVIIAKGEVVVIDENFGVRVTDIINPADRIKKN